jgi:hypothetical protein
MLPAPEVSGDTAGECVKYTEWPPKSPDLNPLHYDVQSALKQRTETRQNLRSPRSNRNKGLKYVASRKR